MPRGGLRSTSFKKGQSGNPSGLAKDAGKLQAKEQAKQAIADLQAAMRALTPLAAERLEAVLRNDKAPAAAVTKAIEIVFDRGWGRAKETIDLNAKMSLEALVLASMRLGNGEEATPVIDATRSAPAIPAPVPVAAIPAPAAPPPQPAFSLSALVAQSHGAPAPPSQPEFVAIPAALQPGPKPPSLVEQIDRELGATSAAVMHALRGLDQIPPSPPSAPTAEEWRSAPPPPPSVPAPAPQPDRGWFYERGEVFDSGYNDADEFVRPEPGMSVSSLIAYRSNGGNR
jgi:hypothetical protein